MLWFRPILPLIGGENLASKKLTEEEKLQWNALYQYVKNEILQYDENQAIPTSLVLRLKGLTAGKLIANNKTKDYADYGYDVVLKTFQMCKVNILNAIRGKNFDSEVGKFNYICKIVENNINDMYIRLKNIDKSKEKTKSISTSILCNESAEYKTANNQINSKLKDLW